MTAHRQCLFAKVIVLAMLLTSDTLADSLVELKSEQKTYIGRVTAHDDSQLWLEEQDGQFQLIEKRDVQEFKKRAGSFRPVSSTDMRALLRKELGSQYEVIGTGNYLVCGQKGSAKKFAEVFEETYRTFLQYFSVRGILPHRPEFPLVAIVFPNQAEFTTYARKDGIQAGGGLAGYYIRTTNRVALFDRETTQALRNPLPGDLDDPFRIMMSGSSHPSRLLFSQERPLEFAAYEGSGTRDTIIHEVTHQMAFNTGVHNRTGHNPRWLVEGLATVFEAPGIRRRDPSNKAINRVNPERFAWFQSYRKARRPAKYLQEFIANEEAFNRQPLDGYAEAWALSFYLLESRPREYSSYLKKIAAREPFETYSSDKRLSDFRSAFGQDVTLLEAAYLRYMQDLK